MKGDQEDHLRFVLNRAYNTISGAYHEGQQHRDNWEDGASLTDKSATALLDIAIDKLAEQLILLVTARVTVGKLEKGKEVVGGETLGDSKH